MSHKMAVLYSLVKLQKKSPLIANIVKGAVSGMRQVLATNRL